MERKNLLFWRCCPVCVVSITCNAVYMHNDAVDPEISWGLNLGLDDLWVTLEGDKYVIFRHSKIHYPNKIYKVPRVSDKWGLIVLNTQVHKDLNTPQKCSTPESGHIQDRSIQVVASSIGWSFIGASYVKTPFCVCSVPGWKRLVRSWIINKHDIILAKGGGPEYLLCVDRYNCTKVKRNKCCKLPLYMHKYISWGSDLSNALD